MPPDLPMTEGTVKVMFTQIQGTLDEIKKDHKEDKNTLHKRVDGVVDSINKEIKPKLQENSTDLSWLKKAFWVLVGGTITFGGSAILALILIVVNGGS